MIFDALMRRGSYLKNLFKPIFINPTKNFDIKIYEPETFKTKDLSARNSEEHIATQWQISEDEEFNNIVFDSDKDLNHLTSLSVTESDIKMLSEYYIRARYYKEEDIGDWSNIVHFQTDIFESVVEDYNESIYQSSTYNI